MGAIGKPEKIHEIEKSPAVPHIIPTTPAPVEPVKTPEKVPA